MDRTVGTYYRLLWSSDWATLTPWSLNSVVCPYIGVSRLVDKSVKLVTFGPLALAMVTIPKKEAD